MTSTADIPEFDPDWVLFQGSGLLAINKPAGIPVHRGTEHPFGLAEMIEAWSRLHPGVLEGKPGQPVHPVHRLDREASGVILFAMNRAAASSLQAAFAAQQVVKRYLAVIAGPVEALGHLQGEVRSRLRGVYRRLPAELTFRRLAGDERLSLVEVEPHGGRNHQIRALFASHERPLAGDLRYGRPKPARQFLAKFGLPSYLLHARALTLPAGVLPAPKTFVAPLPAAFLSLLAQKGWPAPEPS